MQENIKSYNSIYQLREAFRRSGGQSDTFAGEFNRMETPAQMYFRIFFHFNTGHGLLNTGYQYIDPDPERIAYTEDTNTATSYLFTNGEYQRKQMLDDFVNLLSNINTYSPWYFQNIEGLQEALQRPEYTGEFKIDEEPRAIIIKTLEDAYDNRISTLLDLYKAVAFSKIQHKEILPANLRRFDMSIYIINTPIAYVHYGYGDVDREKERFGLNGHAPVPLTEMDDPEVTFEIPSYREWADGSTQIFSSAKLIELRGCEIDANSAASGYGEIKSDEPFGMTHDIKITFRDVIEQRYNDTLNRIIGDCIFMDMDRADRESKDNVWGPGAPVDSKYSSADIVNKKLDAARAIAEYEENPFEYTEDGLILEEKIDPTEGYAESIGFMEDQRQEALDNSLSTADVEGMIIGADSAMIPLPKSADAASKYSMASISGNMSKMKNVPVKDNQNVIDKYKPGIIGGMAQDFLRGAVGAAKSYISSAVAKITMGNLYWGSLSNPQSNFNMGKLGSNLVQRGLDKTVGKGLRMGAGAAKSALNHAKATARGWVSGTSIGSNMSGGSSGHRP